MISIIMINQILKLHVWYVEENIAPMIDVQDVLTWMSQTRYIHLRTFVGQIKIVNNRQQALNPFQIQQRLPCL